MENNVLDIIVCIKQVPMVSELPWNSKTGTLKRELAQGMMDPASRLALEAGVRLQRAGQSEDRRIRVTALTMGPPMAEEVLHQAVSLGADHGVLLTDRKMAGADTNLTSFILGRYIRMFKPDTGLVLCGAQTSDSETAQVGPQLACELDWPAIGWASDIRLTQKTLVVTRLVDDFMETLEMDLPGLVSIDLGAFFPRYAGLAGVAQAFAAPKIDIVDADQLELDKDFNALKDSPTRILDVFSPATQKENRVLKGAAKTVVDKLFTDYGKIISSAMGKDLKNK
ncbi:electron transfer flavoprotein subunit beta/FixA family protein [uncultured Desulfobacter sp.]|uniref:electron transfer flavoprotein subunit beta/FixA family protein n=1 Tax=uncultured Desulfobacter sp. TaxID=240139 RepID=UPI0029C8F277|nr:electron transfer flavoprotein subunit beta/FixA family protein [uncultured Desulfobacter sp.]